MSFSGSISSFSYFLFYLKPIQHFGVDLSSPFKVCGYVASFKSTFHPIPLVFNSAYPTSSRGVERYMSAMIKQPRKKPYHSQFFVCIALIISLGYCEVIYYRVLSYLPDDCTTIISNALLVSGLSFSCLNPCICPKFRIISHTSKPAKA